MRFLFIFIFALGCATPKRATTNFLQHIQKGQFQEAAEMTISGDLQAHPIRRMMPEDAVAILLDKMDFQIIDGQTFQDQASITVKLTNVPFQEIFSIAAREIMEKGIQKLANKEKGLNYDKELKKNLQDKLKKPEIKRQTTTITIELEKIEGIWKIKDNKKVMRLITGL